MPRTRHELLRHALGSLSPLDQVHLFYEPGSDTPIRAVASRLIHLKMLWGVLDVRARDCAAWHAFMHRLKGSTQVQTLIPRSHDDCLEMLAVIGLFPDGHLKTFNGALDSLGALTQRLKIYETMLSAMNNAA